MASSDIFQDLRIMRQEVEHLREETYGLRRQRDVLYHANQLMHNEVILANRRFERAEVEAESLVAKLHFLTEEIGEQRAEMQRLMEQVFKQQRTIKVQSDQIASPQDRKSSRAAQHAARGYSIGDVSQQAPPLFNLPFQPRTPAAKSSSLPMSSPLTQSGVEDQQSGSLQSMPYRLDQSPDTIADRSQGRLNRATKHTEQSSTKSMRQTCPGPSLELDLQHNAHQAATAAVGYQPKPGVSSGSLASLSTLCQKHSSHDIEQKWQNNKVNIATELSNLFSSTERWTHSYCNSPDSHRDDEMPSSLRDRIRSQTNPFIVSMLMSSEKTRFLAVQKLITTDLVAVCLRAGIIQGFHSSFDQRYAKLRIQQKGALPIHIRRALLTACVQITEEACASSGFSEWILEKVDQQSISTWQTMEPVFAAQMDHEKAWSELKQIWRQAYHVGLLMNKRTSLFTVVFPPVGSDSHFNASNMVCRDVQFAGASGVELAAMSLKVAVVVTPIISETDFSVGSDMVPKIAHYADVLVERQ